MDHHGWTDALCQTGYKRRGGAFPVIPIFPWVIREVPRENQGYRSNNEVVTQVIMVLWSPTICAIIIKSQAFFFSLIKFTTFLAKGFWRQLACDDVRIRLIGFWNCLQVQEIRWNILRCGSPEMCRWCPLEAMEGISYIPLLHFERPLIGVE